MSIKFSKWTFWKFQNIIYFNFDIWSYDRMIICARASVFTFIFSIKGLRGLSIESPLWGNEDGALKVYVDRGGLGITFWAPPYSKIGSGRIYSGFTCARCPLPPLPHCICSGSNLRLVETGRWGFTREI